MNILQNETVSSSTSPCNTDLSSTVNLIYEVALGYAR